MSRVGKVPVHTPSGVKVAIDHLSVTVSGPRGILSRSFVGNINISHDGNDITIIRLDENKNTVALHGTTRSIISNMVTGVTVGFKQELEISGVGYRAALQSFNNISYLSLAVGKSHGVKVVIPNSIKVEVPKPTNVLLHSNDNEILGRFIALVVSQCPPEPYKGKGINPKGKRIIRKEGKKKSK